MHSWGHDAAVCKEDLYRSVGDISTTNSLNGAKGKRSMILSMSGRNF